jgi:cyclophilin family peptidyl-prolyl cis-trans isomerase
MKPGYFVPFALCSALLLACSSGSDSGLPEDPHPVVVVKTTLGTMEITLDAVKAPRTVKNFLTYVDSGFYENTLFHRAAHGIMIQGGGYTVGMQEKKTGRGVKNEAANGLTNRRGAIAMAREDAVNSATSQFFIDLKDNPGFDHKDKTKKGFGYAVFGEVTSGMEVADKIDSTLTGPDNGRAKVIVYSVTLKAKQ